MPNSIAEQVFGTMGTICWSGQIIPQIWKSWREKTTEGLSHWLMLIWGIAAVFLGVFVISQDLSIPLMVQPQLFGFLSVVSWSQCLYYGHRKPLRKIILIFIGTLTLLGGFEAGMVFAIRPAVDRGNNRPVTFFGVMTSIIIAVGLLPQYWEIFRFREVKGISIFFIAIDTLGGVFSLLSLVFRDKFDVLGGVAYSLVVVLDGVVIILAIILNPRAERRRRRLARENTDQTAVERPTCDRPDREATFIESGLVTRQQLASGRSSVTQAEKPRDDEEARRQETISEKSCMEADINLEQPK